MSKAKTLHQAIIDINKYISAPSINIKKSLDVTYIPATGRAAGQDGDTIGPGSSAIPNQVKNYEQLDAVRDLMFGKSTGSPGFMAFLLEMQKAGDDAKIDGKSQLAFLPYYPSQKGFGDAGDGQYPDGMEIGATGDLHCGAAIIKSDNYNPDVPDAPEAGHVPVYNFMCTDGSFSRETGDAAAINVFLNSIPTIEMSRCVPYIDMQFIGNPREAGPTPKNTNGHPNIYRFLMGDDSAGWNGWGADLVRAGEAGSDLAGPPAPADPARAVAYEQSGMEVFLSPQTMVNANERTDGTQRTGGFRGTTSGVIDPFRPFMSLNSISLTVAPEVNDIIFSSGQMSITLHDRSRIGEISALTSPRVFGQTWIRLEYGWSHPEKYNDGTGSGFWGGFLNNFRTQECFMVTNSSYTFTATGEVQITLQIASAGASGMITDAKILDDLAINPAKFLAELETSIQSIRDALPENGNGVTIQRPKQLFEAAGANGFHVLDLNSSSMGKAIKRFKASIRANSGAIPDELEAQIAEIFHPDKIAELETSKDKVNDAMDKKLLQLLRAPDPWLSLTALGAEESESGFQHIPSGQLNKSTQNAKYDMLGAGKDYVSIGKLFNLFVAQPLVNGASGNVQYEECQIIYGCINNKASYASGLNIARFPINYKTFTEGIARIKKSTGPNMTLAEFVGFLNNYFLDNEMNEMYGFGKKGRTYTRKINKDTGLYEQDQEMSARNQEKAAGHRNKVLAKAYGSAGDHLEFKQPMIKFYVETRSLQPLDNENEEVVDTDEENKRKKILRIFVEDEKAMSYAGALDLIQRVFTEYLPSRIPTASDRKSANSMTANAWHALDMARMSQFAEQLGLIEEVNGKVTINTDGKWKDLMKGSAPSIDIGSNHTAVVNASVAGQGDSQLQTVHMLNASDGEDPTRMDAEQHMPLVMMPQQITLDLFGCPLLAPLQSYFVDMRTGTDIDALYSVTSVTHNISAGKFTTAAQLTYMGGYASFRPAAQRLAEMGVEMAARGLTVDPTPNHDSVQASIDSLDAEAKAKEIERRKVDSLEGFRDAADLNDAVEKSIVASEKSAARAARMKANAQFTSDTVRLQVNALNSLVNSYKRKKESRDKHTHAQTIALYQSGMDRTKKQIDAYLGNLKTYVSKFADGPEDDPTDKAAAERAIAGAEEHLE